MTRATAPTGQVDAYLARLDALLHDLPRERRAEIVEDIRDHIDEAIADDGGAAGEMAVRTVLERLGDPSEIAADARQRFGVPGRRGVTWQDWCAPWLLALGTSLFVVGWFVGVAFLWRSTVFRRWEKVVGTVVWPFGIAFPFAVSGVATVAAGAASGVAVAALYLAPVLVAIQLTRRVVAADRAAGSRG